MGACSVFLSSLFLLLLLYSWGVCFPGFFFKNFKPPLYTRMLFHRYHRRHTIYGSCFPSRFLHLPLSSLTYIFVFFYLLLILTLSLLRGLPCLLFSPPLSFILDFCNSSVRAAVQIDQPLKAVLCVLLMLQ